MKNKIVGIIVIAIALIIGGMTYYFNSTLSAIHSLTCSMGPSCTANQEINFQTVMGIVFTALLVLAGLYLVFFGQERVEIIKKIREKIKTGGKKNYDKVIKTLTSEEKKLFNLVLESQGAIFQSELVEKSGFDKVKVSRILDRLEGHQLIERRRRGMTNIVVLK
jgi:uncharacterized membrane protein